MSKKSNDNDFIQLGHSQTEKHGYYLKMGKIVTVHFLDGKSITGILNAIGIYELFIQVTNKDKEIIEITIFKHAVKYIS